MSQSLAGLRGDDPAELGSERVQVWTDQTQKFFYLQVREALSLETPDPLPCVALPEGLLEFVIF